MYKRIKTYARVWWQDRIFYITDEDLSYVQDQIFQCVATYTNEQFAYQGEFVYLPPRMMNFVGTFIVEIVEKEVWIESEK